MPTTPLIVPPPADNIAGCQKDAQRYVDAAIARAVSDGASYPDWGTFAGLAALANLVGGVQAKAAMLDARLERLERPSWWRRLFWRAGS